MVRPHRTTAIVHLEGGGEHGYGEEVTFQEERPAPGEPAKCLGGSPGASVSSRSGWRCMIYSSEPRNSRSCGTIGIGRSRLQPSISRSVRRASVSTRRLVVTPEPVDFVVSPAPGFSSVPAGRAAEDRRRRPAARSPVDVIDFKGSGDRAAVESALALYPDALLEDPPVVVPGARVSWDIRITSADEIRRLPDRPSAINVKPARLGRFAELFDVYELCAAEGIALYGGGQHELGPGRAQIQLLASLFHPHGPNDVAPAGYNEPNPGARAPDEPARDRSARSASGPPRAASRGRTSGRAAASPSFESARSTPSRERLARRSCRGGS